MNAPVSPREFVPSPSRRDFHAFNADDMYALFRAGVTPDDADLELIEGALQTRGEGRLHRFTADDFFAMIEAGIIPEGSHVELIEGVLVDMPADGELHQEFSIALNRWLMRSLGDEYAVVPNSSLRASQDSVLSPDFFVFDARLPAGKVTGRDALLAIEQSDSSMRYDLGDKAVLYASSGVREYWAIDLRRRQVHVHREPGPEGYGSKRRFEADQPVDALLIPELTLRIADLSRVGGG